MNGDPSGLITKDSVAKYQKTRSEDPLGTLKNFQKKVAQCRKKSKRGDSLDPSGFVPYLEKVKNERGTLCTRFALAPWPDLVP